MTNSEQQSIPLCVECGGEINYDVKIEAIDGESIENGYTLRVAAICVDCGQINEPTAKMR